MACWEKVKAVRLLGGNDAYLLPHLSTTYSAATTAFIARGYTTKVLDIRQSWA